MGLRAVESQPVQMDLLMQAVNIGLAVLRGRVLILVGMLLTFGLFAWAVWQPDPLRIAAATIFGLLAIFITKQKGEEE